MSVKFFAAVASKKVSSIGSPTYAVSKHLVSILSPLRRNRYSVKNSSEFAQKIQQHTVTSDEILVSFDVNL